MGEGSSLDGIGAAAASNAWAVGAAHVSSDTVPFAIHCC